MFGLTLTLWEVYKKLPIGCPLYMLLICSGQLLREILAAYFRVHGGSLDMPLSCLRQRYGFSYGK